MKEQTASGATQRSSWRQILLLWHYGRHYLLRSSPSLCFWYVLAALTSTAAALSTPHVFGILTNTLTEPGGGSDRAGQVHPIGFFALWLALLLVATPLLNLLHRFLGARVDQHISTHLRNDVFRQVLGQPLPYFIKTRSSRILNLLNMMCRETQQTIRQLTIDALLMLATLAAGTGLVVYNLYQMGVLETPSEIWPLIGLLLLVALAAPALAERFGGKLAQTETTLIEKEESLGSLTRGGVQGVEEIKAFDAVDWYTRRQKALLEEVAAADIHQTVTIEKVNFVNTLPSNLMQVLLVGAALLIVILTKDGANHIGNLVALLLLVPQLTRPLQSLSALLMMMHKSKPSVDRVFRILESPTEEIPDAPSSPSPTNPDPAHLTVRNLTFRYGEDSPSIIDHATFDVTPGKVTALVARMGAGKTTFFRLVMRFFQQESGEIEIDGKAIDEYPLSELRRQVTMMAQFPTFAPDSVRANLLLAASDADDDALIRTCELTGIWPILRQSLGEGQSDNNLLDANFSSGECLSGGQRRLFALTRCLLRNPRILLLDEPTTGIDNREKFALLPRLREACRGRTVLVVDHDVRWLGEFCDEFLVLEEGKITARGTRDALLQGQNLFRELFEKGEASGSPAETS